MKMWKPNERKMFEQIARCSQKNLLKTMKTFLGKKYSKIYSTDQYIYAVGDIPITLVAHLDTVFRQLPATIYCDESKKVLWSPDGLGADDRAGVFGIIQLVRAGLRPSIILTTDEEIGGIGASSFIQAFPEPATLTNYIIQLDRQGHKDCVFYGCNNPDFINYVEDFGFIENFGSFSDISIICPHWKIAGVNLSIGYENEHTFCEILHIDYMISTLSKVSKMLLSNDIPAFEYIPRQSSMYFDDIPELGINWYDYKYPYTQTSTPINCTKCQKPVYEDEAIPVKLLNGRTGFYCPECIPSVGWCEICQEPFELDSNSNTHRCKDCITMYGGSSWPKGLTKQN